MFSPDGFWIATASRDNTTRVREGFAKTGANLFSLKGHTNPVTSAVFSENGSQIVTSSYDGTTKVWDSRPFRDTRPTDPPSREVKKP